MLAVMHLPLRSGKTLFIVAVTCVATAAVFVHKQAVFNDVAPRSQSITDERCKEEGFASSVFVTSHGNLCVLHRRGAPKESYLVTLEDRLPQMEHMFTVPLPEPMHAELLRITAADKPELTRFKTVTFAHQAGTVTNLRKNPEGFYSYQMGVFAGKGIFRSTVSAFTFSGSVAHDHFAFPWMVNTLPYHDAHDMLFTDDEVTVLQYVPRMKADDNSFARVDMVLTAISRESGEETWRFDSAEDMSFPDASGDYLHTNSLQWIPELGSYLVSAKNTNALYLIRRSDKAVTEISCRTFDCGADAGWSDQHDASIDLDRGMLLLYDNAEDTGRRSRAVEYAIDLKSKTLKKMREFFADAKEPFRPTLGSARSFEDGGMLVGWGGFDPQNLCKNNGETHRDYRDVFTRFDASGSPVFIVRAPCGIVTYRVFSEE